MKALFRYIFLIVILCTGFVAKAETMYPIQLTAAMLPPYTNSLGDYFNDKMHRLKLTAVVRDRQEQHKHLDVFVKIIVKQGSSQKAPVFVTRTLHTPYAMMYDIPTDGIAAQLASDNDGYVVPEGAYEFIFQIFDAHNDRLPLSEPTSVFCYLAEAEAPECIYPVDNSCIPITVSNGQSNQPVVLAWMDRTTTNLAFRKYIVELYSDDVATGASEDLNPMFGGDDVIGKHLILQKEVNNVNFLSIANNAGVSFTNGKKYYWHVAGVSAGNDGSMTNYARSFNNKLHYSALSSFTYGCEKEKPEINYDEELVVKGISTNNSAVSATITWGVKDNDDPSALDKYCGYRLYFTPKVKKADNEENTENVDQSNQNAEDNADNKAALSDAGTSDSDSNTENKENEENTSEEKKTVVVEVGKTTTYTLNAIERSKEYDVAVQGILCDDASAELKISEPRSFMIPEEEKKNCDVNLHPVECTSLLELKEGEWFYANDNDAIVKISTLPKDGNLGTGVVTCTLFKEKLGLIVKFDDKVKVNTDHYLCEGEVVVDSEGDRSAMLNVNDVAGKGRTAPKAAFQKELKTAETKEAITSSEKNEVFRNNVVANGDNVYAVTKDGTAAEIGEVTSDVTPSQGSLDNESGVIVFQRDEKLNKSWSPYIDYSAAPITETSIINEYERMGGSYIVPWASMECGETRWVKAVPQLANNDNKKLSEFKNVVFYARIGDKYIKLKHEVLDEAACTYKVQLFGGEANKSYPVYAMNSSKTKTYGRLNVYNMKYKKYKIRIVPVVNDVTFNGASGEINNLTESINAIFSPLAKAFEMHKAEPFTNANIKEGVTVRGEEYNNLDFITNDGLSIGDVDKLFAYQTDETRALMQLYKKNVEDEEDVDAYLFIVPQFKEKEVSGFMPRTYSVGFVVADGNKYDDYQTMAHELSHGVFGLEHIFNYEGVAKGGLAENLMDYAQTDLRYPSKYFQWYNVENPSDYHFPFVDDAQDGQNYVLKGMSCLLQSIISEMADCYVFDSGKEPSISNIVKEAGWNFATKKLDPVSAAAVNVLREVIRCGTGKELQIEIPEFDLINLKFKGDFDVDIIPTKDPCDGCSWCKKIGEEAIGALIGVFLDDKTQKKLKNTSEEKKEKMVKKCVEALKNFLGKDYLEKDFYTDIFSSIINMEAKALVDAICDNLACSGGNGGGSVPGGNGSGGNGSGGNGSGGNGSGGNGSGDNGSGDNGSGGDGTVIRKDPTYCCDQLWWPRHGKLVTSGSSYNVQFYDVEGASVSVPATIGNNKVIEIDPISDDIAYERCDGDINITTYDSEKMFALFTKISFMWLKGTKTPFTGKEHVYIDGVDIYRPVLEQRNKLIDYMNKNILVLWNNMGTLNNPNVNGGYVQGLNLKDIQKLVIYDGSNIKVDYSEMQPFINREVEKYSGIEIQLKAAMVGIAKYLASVKSSAVGISFMDKNNETWHYEFTSEQDKESFDNLLSEFLFKMDRLVAHTDFMLGRYESFFFKYVEWNHTPIYAETFPNTFVNLKVK